jgi:ABC-type uncharacterized transport system YnjBCD ATPase subunit
MPTLRSGQARRVAAAKKKRKELDMIFVFVILVLARLVPCQGKGTTPPPTSPTEQDDGLLVWDNLSVNVSTTLTGNDVVLLHPTSGQVPAGHLCGILGSSGAGKSTFLRALAGMSSDVQKVDGHVGMFHYPNNQDNNHTFTYHGLLAHQVAFLDQHDSFFSGLTVEESLGLAAFLELPTLPDDVRHELVTTQLT